jgi:hypothetical protein
MQASCDHFATFTGRHSSLSIYPQLASSSGNILDDEALITALGESKTASDQVRTNTGH